MIKSYEAIYENEKLNWIGSKPDADKVKVLVIFEEKNTVTESTGLVKDIKSLKGIAPKPDRVVSLEEMDAAIRSMGKSM